MEEDDREEDAALPIASSINASSAEREEEIPEEVVVDGVGITDDDNEDVEEMTPRDGGKLEEVTPIEFDAPLGGNSASLNPRGVEEDEEGKALVDDDEEDCFCCCKYC